MDAPAAAPGPPRPSAGADAASRAAGAAAGPPSGPDPLASGPAAFGREARHPLAGGRRVADLVASVVLLVVLTAEAVVAGWAIVFLSLAFASCGAPGNSCNEALGGAVVYTAPVIVALVLVAALVTCVLRLVHRRLAWPFAVVGMAAVVAVFFGALLLVESAVSVGI
uniref:Uncharacterized protein n=1 Tax=Neobacillus citreus TaxID=2833578 RepID=A0A942T0C5_9BACI